MIMPKFEREGRLRLPINLRFEHSGFYFDLFGEFIRWGVANLIEENEGQASGPLLDTSAKIPIF
jgi:hypothetical protein